MGRRAPIPDDVLVEEGFKGRGLGQGREVGGYFVLVGEPQALNELPAKVAGWLPGVEPAADWITE